MQHQSLSSARPRGHRLALVLGSGGVRSIAALGIAQRLAQEGLRPDLIAGCSSGALFGAQIAMGLQGDQALRAATSLWSAELTQQRRWRAYVQILAPRLAGFGTGFALRDDRLIAERIARAFGDAQLERLETPLRVSATDAASGRPVVLTHGSVVDALRASMAVPVIFPSVEIAGRRLVDGVLSDPLPFSAATDAQVVVALGFNGAMPRRVDRLSRLVAQTSTTLINNLMQARMDAARAAGQAVIGLELGLDRHVGLWDTAAMPYLFEAGRRAVQARLTDIFAALEQAGSSPTLPLFDFQPQTHATEKNDLHYNTH
ncbi:patatin-like phospholipase family protein [Polaromonas sp.]|uniref:patatin-like phospholipase family protein n=1 Tax=Polaromonas sp. TaxID=1869339 RepID=UPI00248736C3|nr:patatin-like phospholipase family protein [Polaromonas sp.]MDI1338464.1 patatin-like phospholipase family protein [Polaromonas sp.]